MCARLVDVPFALLSLSLPSWATWMTNAANVYHVTDKLYLWWLGVPDRPLPIGTLRLLRATSGVSLQFAPDWLRRGFPLSEDLPLTANEHSPSERESVAGAVDDARPDRWGERVIRFIDKPPRLSLLEYLYFAGDERFGALGVSISADRYLPQLSSPLPRLVDLEEIREAVRKVEANEPVPESKRRLIAPGTTLGAARPVGYTPSRRTLLCARRVVCRAIRNSRNCYDDEVRLRAESPRRKCASCSAAWSLTSLWTTPTTTKRITWC